MVTPGTYKGVKVFSQRFSFRIAEHSFCGLIPERDIPNAVREKTITRLEKRQKENTPSKLNLQKNPINIFQKNK